MLFHRADRFEGDCVYRPDIVYFGSEKKISSHARLTVCPDVVVDVVSQGTRRLDTIQKRADYERFGVREYWIFDPQTQAMTFLKLVDGKYVPILPNDDTFESVAIPGFVLQIAPIREEFKPW